jgi:hypothetical protein
MLLKRVDMQPIVLVIFFAFCQVIGTMCVLPDVSATQDIAVLMEEGMSCPMDGTVMCPPSITSSPERDLKHTFVADVDAAPVLVTPAVEISISSNPMLLSWSSAYSIVPISIASSSVLRI